MNIIDTLSAVLFGISVMILFILTLYVIVEPQHLKKVQNNKQYYAFSDAFNLETLKQNLERHEPIEPIKKEISNGGPSINSIIKIEYIDFGVIKNENYIDLRW